MIRITAASLLAAVSSCTTPGGPHAAPPSQLSSQLLERTNKWVAVPGHGGVVVIAHGGDQPHSCNAVAISPLALLTAAHCCADKVYVIPSAESLNRWDGQSSLAGLTSDTQEALGCHKAPRDARADAEEMDKFRVDIALIRLAKPLPLLVVPARRLDTSFIVQKAPLLELDGMSVSRLYSLAPSGATSTLSQYVPRGRFVGTGVAPMVATLKILGFDVSMGTVVLVAGAPDLVMSGTSGSGVFVAGADGEPRLLAITTSSIVRDEGTLVFAIDVRQWVDWIDAEMARAR